MEGGKNSRKGKPRNRSRKNIIGFERLKIKIIKKRTEKKEKERENEKKKNYTELQKPNGEADVYNNNKK